MRQAVLALTLAGIFFAAPSLAIQDAAPAQPRAREDSRAQRRPDAPPDPAAAPLSGPRVRLTEAPGVYMSFGGEGAVRMFRANLRLYANALRQMELTDEQRRQADLIGAEYGQALREHQEQYGVEQRRLQQRLSRLEAATDRPLRRAAETDQAPRRREAVENQSSNDREAQVQSNERPNAPRDTGIPPRRPRTEPRAGADAVKPADSMGPAEILARLSEIRRAIPPQEPYMLRLHNLLSPQQKEEFEQHLLEQVRLQGEMQLQRRLAAAGRDAPAMNDEGGMMMTEGMVRTDDGKVIIDESLLTPQMRQRLERLRAQRQRLLENRDRINPQPPSPEEIEFETDAPRRPETDRRPEEDEG